MTMPESAAAARVSPTMASQGRRSSSVSGVADAILATFASGCRASASTNAVPSRAASADPTVVLPAPETPATTISGVMSQRALGLGPGGQRGEHGDLDRLREMALQCCVQATHRFPITVGIEELGR